MVYIGIAWIVFGLVYVARREKTLKQLAERSTINPRLGAALHTFSVCFALGGGVVLIILGLSR